MSKLVGTILLGILLVVTVGIQLGAIFKGVAERSILVGLDTLFYMTISSLMITLHLEKIDVVNKNFVTPTIKWIFLAVGVVAMVIYLSIH